MDLDLEEANKVNNPLAPLSLKSAAVEGRGL